jgi:hypothetical protein
MINFNPYPNDDLFQDFVGRPQMPLDVFINEKFLSGAQGDRLTVSHGEAAAAG